MSANIQQSAAILTLPGGRARNNAPVETGGGGGHSGGMDHTADIAVLQQRADQADARMGRVEDKLDRIIEALGAKATRQDVWTALATGAAIAFGVLAIMIAILTYLQDQRIATRPDNPPPQVVIQVPTPAAPAAGQQ